MFVKEEKGNEQRVIESRNRLGSKEEEAAEDAATSIESFQEEDDGEISNTTLKVDCPNFTLNVNTEERNVDTKDCVDVVNNTSQTRNAQRPSSSCASTTSSNLRVLRDITASGNPASCQNRGSWTRKENIYGSITIFPRSARGEGPELPLADAVGFSRGMPPPSASQRRLAREIAVVLFVLNGLAGIAALVFFWRERKV